MGGKLFAHYEPAWSPIRDLVTAAIPYSQSRCVTIITSQRAKPSHFCYIVIRYVMF